MKHLLTFESILSKDKYTEIEKGDFATFHYDNSAVYSYAIKFTPELKSFINDNIGIINNVSSSDFDWIEVIYEDIPNNIKPAFSNNNSILLQKDAIVAFAKDIKELNIKLSANKYNL